MDQSSRKMRLPRRAEINAYYYNKIFLSFKSFRKIYGSKAENPPEMDAHFSDSSGWNGNNWVILLISPFFSGAIRYKKERIRREGRYVLRQDNPRRSRANPIITCTNRQVGRLSRSLLLPTSAVAGGLQTDREVFPASRRKDVGLSGSVTHPAGNFSVFIGSSSLCAAAPFDYSSSSSSKARRISSS